MIHFGSFEIDTGIFVFAVSIFAMLIQLLLCFKAKKLSIRLIPTVLFLIPTIVFAILMIPPFSSGWDSLAFLFLALYTGCVTLFCGIGWGIWAIINKIKEKR